MNGVDKIFLIVNRCFVFCFGHYSPLPRNLDKRTTITIGDQTTTVEANDLQKICDLGRGAYGIVEKMRHIPSGTIMAVKVSDDYDNDAQLVADGCK